jgi:hypothetical protein
MQSLKLLPPPIPSQNKKISTFTTPEIATIDINKYDSEFEEF